MYSIPSDDELDFVEDRPDEKPQKLFEKHLNKLKSIEKNTRQTPDIPGQSLENVTTVKLSSHGSGTSSVKDISNEAAAISRAVDSVEAATAVAGNPSKPTASFSAGYRILVNKKQKGNPVLKFIRNVPWEYDAIIPDYELGQCHCALYLSLKYHNRFPDYIHNRLKELGKKYELRILLVQVDTKQQDVSHELNQLAKICMLADCTLILAFSYEEAGRYLEIYKAYEHKPPTEIMGRVSTDFISQASDSLTSIKGINKTDVTTLLSRFKTMKNVMAADVDTLGLCPGIGPLKARRLHAAFHTPFLKSSGSSKPGAKTSASTLSETAETATNLETQDGDLINDDIT